MLFFGEGKGEGQVVGVLLGLPVRDLGYYLLPFLQEGWSALQVLQRDDFKEGHCLSPLPQGSRKVKCQTDF